MTFTKNQLDELWTAGCDAYDDWQFGDNKDCHKLVRQRAAARAVAERAVAMAANKRLET